MGTAGNFNIVIEQGATLRYRVEIPEFDCTGYSAAMKVRTLDEDPEAILSLTSDEDGGLTIEQAEDNTWVTIEIPPEDSVDLEARTHLYDLKIIGADTFFALAGRFIVIPRRTHDDD